MSLINSEYRTLNAHATCLWWIAALALLLCGGSASSAHAQSASSEAERDARAACPDDHPTYRFLRHEEHWDYLAAASCRTDYADPLKHIAVGDGSFFYVGGEVRSLVEGVGRRGTVPADNDTYLLQRATLHTGLQLGRRPDGVSGRLFAELKSGFAPGLDEVTPPDRDTLDLGQAIAEVSYAWDGASAHGSSEDELSRLMLRAGRFELHYGAGRMISVREGPNVRASFDGGLARFVLGGGLLGTDALTGWRADAFATRPNTTHPGVFDNRRTDGAALWGVYAKGPLRGGHALDAYYLGFEREGVRYAQGRLNQTRHTVGARWVYNGVADRWTHDLEVAVQFGAAQTMQETAGDSNGERLNDSAFEGDVLAWRIASEMTYTFAFSNAPTLGLSTDVSSGDRDPAAVDLQTFTAPYPPGRYYDGAVPFGPSNLVDVQPTVSVRVLPWLTAIAGAHVFWRTSVHDGAYAVPGIALRTATADGGAAERFLGWAPGVILTAKATPHLTFGLEVNQFRPGGYYAQSGTDAVVHYLGVEATYKF